MKKFELYMGIAILIGATVLNMILVFTISLELDNVFLIVVTAALEYGVANRYLDSYLGRHEIHHYDKGKNAAYKDMYKEF